jgi:hypothetical protein
MSSILAKGLCIMLSITDLAPILDIVRVYWIVPAGMLALYFYGKFHFNTPEYLLDLGNSASPATRAGPGARLITPAPHFYGIAQPLQPLCQAIRYDP